VNNSIFCPDGAQTFFNSEFQEAYHSKIGPITESLHKFVKPCESILKRSFSREVKILDLFFGLGYNSGVAIDFIYNLGTNPNICITAIEKDKNIIEKIREITVPEGYIKWKELLQNLDQRDYIEYEKIKIKLILDDIFNALKSLENNTYDIIFFDPFSFKVAPQFWTEEFLLSVFKLLSKGGRLTTYSGLKRVEKLATDNGFNVIRVDAIGRKTHSLCIESCFSVES